MAVPNGRETVRVDRPSPWILAGLILLCLLVGWLGSFVTIEQIPRWYQALAKPSWTPPNWLFGPVWTTLYVLMGIAGWRVAGPAPRARAAWHVWWGQLALNAIWTPLFFGAHQLGAALIVILLLCLLIVRFIVLAWRSDRLASLLFMPYLLWVGYASSLNAAIWVLN